MCTAVTYKTDHFYFGRTLDYDFSYCEEITFCPRIFRLSLRNGKRIDCHYAIIGMAYVKDGFPLYYDAVNEKGLCMAGLNFPENACYFPTREDRVNITQFELLPYILCKCESVCEARELLANIISLKPKVSISLLIYQKYHSNEVGIALKIMSSKLFASSIETE